MIKIKKWRFIQPDTRGQGLVELALVLPLLVLLLLGIVELGFTMYDYLTLATANREGVRLASRARFTDEMVTQLVVSSSGLIEQDDGSFKPNMVLIGEGANLGVIITHLSFDTSGSLIGVTTYVSGTIVDADDTPRPITLADTHLSSDDLQAIVANSSSATSNINTYREAMSYDRIPEEVVIVETFLAHELLTSTIVPTADVVTLYFHSTMRVLRDSREAM